MANTRSTENKNPLLQNTNMWLQWTFSWHFVITVKNVKRRDETNQNIVRYNPDSHFTLISKSYSECDRYESVTCLYTKQKETHVMS